MPDPETAGLEQTAVLWGWTGYGLHGEPVLADPIEVPVRWSWNQHLASSAQGERISVAVDVVVDRDVALGSLMWEGTLADWAAQEGQYQYVMEVATYTETPDIRDRAVYRTLGLTFYKGSVP